MGDSSRLAVQQGESLGLGVWDTPSPSGLEDLRTRRLEFTSHGDRVPARLLLPPSGSGPFPLVLLQHEAGGSKDAEYLDAVAGPWCRGGAAVLGIDFPLHGERRSEKLSERVLEALATHRESDDGSLWVDLARQAVRDLQRALDAAERLPEIDSDRTAYAGFSMGTILGATFLGIDPRPLAGALAIGGGGFGPPATDPVNHPGAFAPRPQQFVNAERDERIPRSASEALFEAAGEPKRIEWFDCSHSELPGRALKSMWGFLRDVLKP
jgi:dienelactone hydrolase